MIYDRLGYLTRGASSVGFIAHYLYGAETRIELRPGKGIPGRSKSLNENSFLIKKVGSMAETEVRYTNSPFATIKTFPLHDCTSQGKR